MNSKLQNHNPASERAHAVADMNKIAYEYIWIIIPKQTMNNK